MRQTFNYRISNLICWGIGALLCANLSACSSDTTVHEVEEPQGQIPMQFSQAAIGAPVTRGDNSATLKQGFLVSCYKSINKTTPSIVMDKYEVKYKANQWENSSQWGYVGTTNDGFYQNQVQRYWDASATPYRFYAISPCPATNKQIDAVTLTNEKLTIPETFQYQTCADGTISVPAKEAEPYVVADAKYDNVVDKVALQFHHLTSKVRFAIYSSANKDITISNITITAMRDGGFITSAEKYEANLTTGNVHSGQFKDTQTSVSSTTLLTDNSSVNLAGYSSSNPYAFRCPAEVDGLLQIPQDGVKLSVSFMVDGESEPRNASFTITENGNLVDSFKWDPSKKYTYILNISDTNPLKISFSAELEPWTDVSGDINTSLED